MVVFREAQRPGPMVVFRNCRQQAQGGLKLAVKGTRTDGNGLGGGGFHPQIGPHALR